jgi:hypothetical protein
MCVNESDKIRLIDSTSDDVTAAFTAVVYVRRIDVLQVVSDPLAELA